MTKIIRCLILAHKSVQQVERLVNQLNHPQILIFIHLDKKMEITQDEICHLGRLHKNIYIYPKRNSNYLDNYSLVDTTIELVKFARSIQSDSGYYVLLSGQDYLIKPLVSFVDYLSTNYPKPFIDCTPYDDNNWMHFKFHYPVLCYRILHTRAKVTSIIVKKTLGLCARILSTFTFPKYRLLNRMSLFNIPLYGGSAWWILSDLIIDEILSLMLKYPDFINLYKLAFTPEETFFQTLCMQTSQAYLVDVNSKEQRTQNCLTYANFMPPTGEGFIGHPYVLKKKDWEWLSQRHEFIARKFDIDEDEEILNLIDRKYK